MKSFEAIVIAAVNGVSALMTMSSKVECGGAKFHKSTKTLSKHLSEVPKHAHTHRRLGVSALCNSVDDMHNIILVICSASLLLP